MKHILASFAIVLMCQININAQYTEQIKEYTATPNPTGMELGFHEANQETYVLPFVGRRPTCRVGYNAWNNIEISPGVYDFTKAYSQYDTVHNFGEKILCEVSISFPYNSNRSIPSFYADSITDTATRRAAKNFLYAYVQALLKREGSIVLTIDFEVMSNWKLENPHTQRLAAVWGTWYVEAAAVARQAASDLGMSGNLKLEPIVNGNPLDPTNPVSQGPLTNQWLVNVVSASDYLALDTYESDSIYPNTSTQTTFNIIKFWIDNFSGGKDVVITENGYNTITQFYPDSTYATRKWKTTGTEADQAVYFDSLFARLDTANLPNGIFHNKLRSYNIFSLRDEARYPMGVDKRYFGMIGVDVNNNNYYKPAAYIVQNAYANFEADPFYRPYNINFGAGTDVSGPLLAGTGNVNATYNDGDDFQFLRYTIADLPPLSVYNLYVNTLDTGNIIVHINNQWIYAANNKNFVLNVTPYCLPNDTNIIDVYFTDIKFPFTQTIQYVKLSPLLTTSIESLGDSNSDAYGFILNAPYPNPTTNALLENISFKVDKPGVTKIDILNAQGTVVATLLNDFVNNSSLQKVSWNTQNVSAGVYYVRMTYNDRKKVEKIVVTE